MNKVSETLIILMLAGLSITIANAKPNQEKAQEKAKAAPSAGTLRLPKIIGSNMVLQRNSRIKIWGWGKVGSTVSVKGSWLDKSETGKVDKDGSWNLFLQSAGAGGPHKIQITDSVSNVVLDNILFGEVWIASGQSNMEMTVGKVSGVYKGVIDYENELKNAVYPEIRLFQVGNFSSKIPMNDVENGISMYKVPVSKSTWGSCTPESVRVFAASAYFFAREIHRELKVPVGIIDSSWGGTLAEAWTPLETLKELGYTKEVNKAKTAKQNPRAKVPSRLYNGMIHPLTSLKIRGVIWYQGEGNTGRAAGKYKTLFTAMIESWRKQFAYEFPFYFAQIAPCRSYGKKESAYLREAQFQSLELSKTGMVGTMDIATVEDIHPPNKQDVGRRFALLALKNDYGKSVVSMGPRYKSFKIDGNKISIQFEDSESPLATRDGKTPSHFLVAGEDKVFHAATEVLMKDDEVVVHSEKVSAPKAVRFAFDNISVSNLMNKEGLPAFSFRTDRW
ncbi:sialate O-acetylesterase [Lentisphaera profundi]|uniref:Sialate O-acetylesterase n=1 Tax=Lentisphaera profundi TaxID=1658616 RepID=A0ABY7VXE5_9BACT|nr:sialate O-acetylesterase [Lentisphaera profundi]WDE98915.1 sialate O-acetylesterase [Lentisphaera profundi]